MQILVLIPLAAIPEILLSKDLHIYHAEEKKTYAKVLEFFSETINRILVVKAFQLEKMFLQKEKALLGSYKKGKINRILREMLVEVYGRYYGHITNVIILFLGAYYILHNEMTLGILASIILFTQFVGEGLTVLNQFPVYFQRAKASLDRIQKLLQLSDEESGGSKDSQDIFFSDQKEIPVYEVKALSFKYGKEFVLKNVDFSVFARDKIAIVGLSGCGKTTLFKLLSGLYSPEKNQIIFQGTDITEIPLPCLRKYVTVMTQESFLFHASFNDNIKISSPHSSDELVAQAAKNAQIDSFIKSFPEGYDTIINTTLQSISNGQIQRINLARVFLKGGDVFLFDEPTSALNADIAQKVMDYILSGNRDKTILMITHNLSDVYRFDKILFLDKGRIAGFGTHEELLKKNNLYQKLYYGEK